LSLSLSSEEGQEVGVFRGCVALRSSSREKTYGQWQGFLKKFLKDRCDGHQLCRGAGFYFKDDRCYTAFAACALEVSNGVTIIVQTPVAALSDRNKKPILEKNKYVLLMGPASTLGVASSTSYGEALERELGLPVVNLGRGGFGPKDYISALHFLKEPLIENALAVIVMVMSGRSSENSFCRYESCTTLERAALYEKLLQNRTAADAFARESLDTAQHEYENLLKNINTKVFGLWFSERPMDIDRTGKYQNERGITYFDGNLQFPQFYAKPQAAYDLKWLFQHLNNTFIDASWPQDTGDDLPIDKCHDCRENEERRKTCTIENLRHEASGKLSLLEIARLKINHSDDSKDSDDSSFSRKNSLPPNACTYTCNYVKARNYYGNARAHHFAATQLLPHLNQLLLLRQEEEQQKSSSFS